MKKLIPKLAILFVSAALVGLAVVTKPPAKPQTIRGMAKELGIPDTEIIKNFFMQGKLITVDAELTTSQVFEVIRFSMEWEKRPRAVN